MKKIIQLIIIGLLLGLNCLVIPKTFAQGGDGYDLSWFTVDAGESSSGGAFILTGVIGQPDAGVISGGEFSLSGGFLFTNTVVNNSPTVYLPLIIKCELYQSCVGQSSN